LISYLQTIEDTRQASKVKYSIGEIVLLVLIGQLVGAEGFTQIELYLKHYESVMRKNFYEKISKIFER
ncbi:MAG: transposase family protein, partial [Lactobacillales bacterium]|nr:transposase family protein [Lactobacillales bacterium]